MSRHEYDESLCPHDDLVGEVISGQRTDEYICQKCGKNDFSRDAKRNMESFNYSHTTSEYIDEVNAYLKERSKVSFVNDISIKKSGAKHCLVIEFQKAVQGRPSYTDSYLKTVAALLKDKSWVFIQDSVKKECKTDVCIYEFEAFPQKYIRF